MPEQVPQKSAEPRKPPEPNNLPSLLWVALKQSVKDFHAVYWATLYSLSGAPRIPERDSQKSSLELKTVEARLGTNDSQKLAEWLYGELNIVDSKANGILSLNAIGLAVVTFLLQLNGGASASPTFRIFAVLCLLVLTWSIVTISSIFLVYWTREKEIKTAPGGITVLLYLSNMRSQVLRSSAVRAVIAFVVLAMLVAIATLAR